MIIVLLIIVLLGCSNNQVIKNEKKVNTEKVTLGIIEKIEIPRIEKKDNKIKVIVWGKKPSPFYKEKEVVIENTDTGYLIKIFFEESENREEIEFCKEVYLDIKKSGGYDIEVIGKNSSLIDIVYIDE